MPAGSRHAARRVAQDVSAAEFLERLAERQGERRLVEELRLVQVASGRNRRLAQCLAVARQRVRRPAAEQPALRRRPEAA